jgi:hypothetical protein
MTLNTAQIPLVARHLEVYEPCDDSFALVNMEIENGILDDNCSLYFLPRLASSHLLIGRRIVHATVADV